jgi:hypothetical protein
MPSFDRRRWRLTVRFYEDSLTLEQAGLADAMLAYELDGQPLRREHGVPARVVIPEMYGYKNVNSTGRRCASSTASTSTVAPGFAAAPAAPADSMPARSSSRPDRRVHAPVRDVRVLALVRRARHPLPLRQHDPAPRRPDVRERKESRRAITDL